MEGNTLDQRTTQGGISSLDLMGTLLLAVLLLAMILAVLFVSGELLVSLPEQAQASATYLHELFHDGRHLLGVPCH